jgi:hypothetical protein
MSGSFEHIRMEVNGEPPQVLRQIPWSGTEPARDYFAQIASVALRSYFKDDGRSLEPKGQFGPLRGKPPVAEAIRFIRPDGRELYRYDLHDMMRDNSSGKVIT